MSSDFSVKLLNTEAERREHGTSVWVLSIDGVEVARVVHLHAAVARQLLNGAWYSVGAKGRPPVGLHFLRNGESSRDFGDALTLARELVASAHRKAKRSKGGAR